MYRGRRFGGLTSKCLGRLRGNSPFWRSCSALRHIAERGRCNRLAICDTEFVGHKVTNSRSSSSVHWDMAGLVMVAPAPGAMTVDSCGAILVIASIPRHQGCKPSRISTNSALNLPGRPPGWPGKNADSPRSNRQQRCPILSGYRRTPSSHPEQTYPIGTEGKARGKSRDFLVAYRRSAFS